MAVGNAPLPEFLMKEFVEKITPHRERALPHVRVSLYLCTSTLQSKVSEILEAKGDEIQVY